MRDAARSSPSFPNAANAFRSLVSIVCPFATVTEKIAFVVLLHLQPDRLVLEHAIEHLHLVREVVLRRLGLLALFRRVLVFHHLGDELVQRTGESRIDLLRAALLFGHRHAPRMARSPATRERLVAGSSPAASDSTTPTRIAWFA